VLNELNITYQYSLIATLVLSGLFVDIIGPRTVLILVVGAAVASNFVFGNADSVSPMLYSRVVIGYTHPFILTGVLTLGTHWLPRRHFSLFVGLFFGTLLMVPEIITPYLQNIATLDEFGTAMLYTNVVGILVVVAIVLTEPIVDRTRHRHTVSSMFRPLTHYKLWLISLVSMIGWMANTFVLQFGTFYLIHRQAFGLAQAADTVNAAFIYFGLGAVVMGIFSDFLRSKRYLIAWGYALAALSFSILFFIPHLPMSVVPTLVYISAFLTSSTIICYTKANDYCTIGNSGITLGLVLSLTTIGSSLFARGMRVILVYYVNDPSVVDNYHWTLILLIIPALLLIGAMISVTLLKPAIVHHHHTEPVEEKPPLSS
jgi:predicted MFS family arabinose efflux permease